VVFGSPLLTDALITNRDGIVGQWRPVTDSELVNLPVEGEAKHLDLFERWEPWVRASLLDFEMFSHLAFSAGQGKSAGEMSVWHLEIAPGDPGDPPTAKCQPLVTLIRPSEEIFKAQLECVNGYSDLREDRASEVLAQIDGPAAFLSSIAYLRVDRTRWTLELLDAALRLAEFVEMRLKHALACRRPIEYSPQVQPMVLTPSHGSLPSGHATESFTGAIVLWSLLRASKLEPYANDSLGDQLMRQAARIAINRTVAGVHFPADSAAGAILGVTLGRYLVARCGGAERYPAAGFNGKTYPEHEDFTWGTDDTLYQIAGNNPTLNYDKPYVVKGGEQALQREDNALTWLWEKALREWT
jgi:hypothetical protein